jgi:hypothetical protein
MVSYKLWGTGLVVLLGLPPRLQIIVTMITIHTQINPYTFDPSPNASRLSRLKLYISTYRIQDQEKNPDTNADVNAHVMHLQVLVSKIR